MKLTLAMGLHYDPNPGSKNLPSGREGITASFESDIDPVIDVEAVAVELASLSELPMPLRSFEYLTYNLRSGLVFLPVIGTQLNMTI